MTEAGAFKYSTFIKLFWEVLQLNTNFKQNNILQVR